MQIPMVGGSLARAFLALEPRGSEHQVSVFDQRAPWEKPRGGGLSAQSLRRCPVQCAACVWNCPSRLRLVSSTGDRTFATEGQWAIGSRADLNGGLRRLARQHANVRFVPDRVTGLERLGRRRHAETAGCVSLAADVVIGVDGVNSLVRRTLSARLPQDQTYLAVGCLLSGGPADEALIQTYPDLIGYALYFLRPHRASIGVGTLAVGANVPGLRRLDALVDKRHPHARRDSKWGAALHAVSDRALWAEPCAGPNWALIGDAAGHVNTLLGEGMTYALTDAHLAARAIQRGSLPGYEGPWRREYGPWLRHSGDALDYFLQAGASLGCERPVALALGGSNLLAKRCAQGLTATRWLAHHTWPGRRP
jgi:flavin-dependent dehydrogenase